MFRKHITCQSAEFTFWPLGTSVISSREIRDSATPDHIKLVKDVYGPSVLEPPQSIYGVGVSKRVPE